MKKYTLYFLSALLVLILSLILISQSNDSSLYGKVSVVETKEEALESLNTSIPEQIIIYTNFYRDTNITNKLEINNILNLINTIKNSSSEENKVLESNNSSSKIFGKIIYNNKVDVFALDNKLIFNNKTYNPDSYLINNLHRKLINYFNTYNHLIDILNTKNSDVLLLRKGDSFHLNNNQKKVLVKNLSELTPMTDEEKLNETKISDEKLYTLKVKINKDIDNKTNNLIFIDVYKNYVIIQFLADDNGKKIYLKGSINEI